MAAVDTTITANTWISNVAAGLADGSSLANRKLFTGIGSLVVNVDAKLTLVHDSTGANWAIVLGNGEVAAKTFTCYGTLECVDENGVFNKASAIRCAIGGTTAYKEGAITLAGKYNIFNIDFGQDSAGNPTCNAGYSPLCYDNYGYVYNSTRKSAYAGYGAMICGVWESCTFNGDNSGVSTVLSRAMNFQITTLISCTQITTGTYWAYDNNPRGNWLLNIVGGITKGGAGGGSIYLSGQDGLTVHHYRRAYIKATTDGTTALAGVAYSAYEATGGVDMPLTAGVTGADGLCTPESPTAYNDSIWLLEKVETYLRLTAGAMTWGTPTSTVTYGMHTLWYNKAGYVGQTRAVDVTGGADSGTLANPVAITMVAEKDNFRDDGLTW
jgi:hypothetical protein